MAVGVIVTPGRGPRHVRIRKPDFLGNISKISIIVPVETVGLVSEPDEDVEVSVIIEICDGIRESVSIFENVFL